jgi:hypothetical protein
MIRRLPEPEIQETSDNIRGFPLGSGIHAAGELYDHMYAKSNYYGEDCHMHGPAVERCSEQMMEVSRRDLATFCV